MIAKNLLGQYAPLAVALDGDEDVDAVSAAERAIRRNRDVREADAFGGKPASSCNSGTVIQSAMASNMEMESSAPSPVRCRSMTASRIAS